jgi:putative peptide zinc metalloprotease protein
MQSHPFESHSHSHWSQLRPTAKRFEVVSSGAPVSLLRFTNGQYLRASQGVVALLRTLDGTRSLGEVADAAASGRGISRAAALTEMQPLVEELCREEILDGAELPSSGRRGLARRLQTAPRLYLIRRPWPIRSQRAPRVAVGFRSIRRVLLAVCFASAVVIGILAATVLAGPDALRVAWWAVLPIVFAAMAFHEFAHGYACSRAGVAVRGCGVALSLYVIPVLFVDRTDAYAVSGRARAAIAAAGPIADWVVGGAVALVALAASPDTTVGGTLTMVVGLQCAAVLRNVLPFAPTDGSDVIEALSGEDNFRGRALGYAARRLLRMPLPLSLSGASRARRRAYFAFSVVTALLVLECVSGLAVGFLLLLGVR